MAVLCCVVGKVTLRFLPIPFVLLLFTFGSCTFGASKLETDFRMNLERLIGMFRDYEEIPTKQKPYEDGFVNWKDEEKLKTFYGKYADQFVSIDNELFQISTRKPDNPWWDDAVFCRAMLNAFWIQVDPDKENLNKTVAVLNEFLKYSPGIQLDSLTRTQMGELFLKAHQHLFTPNLSFEQTAIMVARGYLGYVYAKLERYDDAIREYEAIRTTHPDSKYSAYIREHVEVLRDIQAGRRRLPGGRP